ncbi:tetratricopeptide repeat-containing sulfotransferase family protein [Thalassotalea agarivorans]|uniref:Tetratricopeptide repeat-containing protein n=1 Tax=Thalassotalea agarivorans TaxID=349064 RepID=A0A1I0FGV1_THASX|nr:tetratricopeptide repeat-containing sulfotransferase family protein [Thalassotalea agarivorans]SET57242.1 Tetratricopeptide repeat-containing protein [Thalassotalea agarivorans]
MNDISTLHKRAIAALNKKDYAGCHHNVMAILQQDKYFADGYFLLAMIAAQHQNALKATQLIEQALKLSPDNTEYMAQLARQYVVLHRHIDAKSLVDKALALNPTNTLTLDTLGVVLNQLGLHDAALPLFQQVVLASPDNTQFQFNLGATYKFLGQFEQAKGAFEQCIKLTPDFAKAYMSLSSLSSTTSTVLSLDNLAKINAKSADDKLYLAHAKARLHESSGDYAGAYRELFEAKQHKLASLNYSFEADQHMFDSLHQVFGEGKIKASNIENSEAIFIVGMPRTGTTLLERIVSNNPQVCSAGELQYFGQLLKRLSASQSPHVIDPPTIDAASHMSLDELGQAYIDSTRVLTGSHEHFIDKMPLNVLYAGFMLNALPNSKVLCLARNPLDTIISNYRQLFAVNYSYYNYAYSLESCARYYIEFVKLSQLWQRLFPDNYLTVNYEELVQDPERVSRQIYQFCGLSWDPSCLDIASNKQAVATASAVQVRSSITDKNIGNWRRYDAELDKVKSLLDEAGIVWQ